MELQRLIEMDWLVELIEQCLQEEKKYERSMNRNKVVLASHYLHQ